MFNSSGTERKGYHPLQRENIFLPNEDLSRSGSSFVRWVSPVYKGMMYLLGTTNCQNVELELLVYLLAKVNHYSDTDQESKMWGKLD